MRTTIRYVVVLTVAALVLTATALPAQGGGGDKERCSVRNLRTRVDSDDLQSQIDAAGPGDTLKIRGVCVGHFAIPGGADLTLLGKERAGVPATLEGNFRNVLTIGAGSAGAALVTLTDLTITGGWDPSGGGILIYHGVVHLAGSSKVTGNGADMGGGIYISWGSLFLDDSSQVSDNEAEHLGGGIYTYEGYVYLKDDSKVLDNTAKYGNGGGILSHASRTWLQDRSRVEGNEGWFGGGIASKAGTLILDDDSTVVGNKAVFDGGGIYIDEPHIYASMLLRSTVTGNTADAIDIGDRVGGGIYGCVTDAVAGSNVYDNFRGTTSPVPDDIANGCD